ncbi:MAG: cadmium-translocating P-type ATPase [Clostridia bacterium]|nr:cadmium-translocating P-type ATPase [Clostridia bacterium]
MKTLLHIENLDCPVCAEALQSDLQKIKGVISAQVDYVSQTIALETADGEAVKKAIRTANRFEEVRVLDEGMYATKPKTRLKEWLLIACSAIFLAVGLLLGKWTDKTAVQIVQYILFAVAYLSVGYPVLIATAKNIVKGRVFDENFLMTVASIGAVALGEIGEGVLVMLLYQLGELLQSIAVGSSRSSVAKLMDLKSEWATRIENGEQKQVKPEELKVGDILLVKAGEKVPADGVLRSETAVLDTKSLTGEAEPRRVEKGGELLSGCINAGGVYEMEVTRPYADSAVGKILDMVENAASGKAKPERFITKFAKIYTPVVCILAVALALFAPLLGGLIADGRLYFKDIDRWVQSALTFLVISCPCALIISVPLTYFSGIGACAKHGVLVKGAVYLDTVAKAKLVAFDKTGTLTEGDFTVQAVYPETGVSETELLSLVAAVEKNSSHPIAKAFSDYQTSDEISAVREVAGYGLTAEQNGVPVLVGKAALLRENGIPCMERTSHNTLVYAARGGVFLGAIEIGDELKKEAKQTIVELKKLGFARSVMLTGDHEHRARAVAENAGVKEVYASLLPDEKLRKAEELKKDGVLVYVGDGINDAPVMMTADCAVSMGKLGSAAAVEASDMVLISDNLSALPKGVEIARKTRKIVMQNIWFSILMKAAFMALGACGVLPLWLAVFADVGVMLLAVLNSFRVRK